RRALPATVDAVPGLLRGRLRRAPYLRGPDAARQAAPADCRNRRADERCGTDAQRRGVRLNTRRVAWSSTHCGPRAASIASRSLPPGVKMRLSCLTASTAWAAHSAAGIFPQPETSRWRE